MKKPNPNPEVIQFNILDAVPDSGIEDRLQSFDGLRADQPGAIERNQAQAEFRSGLLLAKRGGCKDATPPKGCKQIHADCGRDVDKARHQISLMQSILIDIKKEPDAEKFKGRCQEYQKAAMRYSRLLRDVTRDLGVYMGRLENLTLKAA